MKCTHSSKAKELKHEKWMCELASAVDITTHLNESNIGLQGKDFFISSTSDHVKGFEIKLPLLAITVAKHLSLRFLTPLKCRF
jgi:hypothetical protein